MPGNPRDMIVSAERRFPVRIRIGVPPGDRRKRLADLGKSRRCMGSECGGLGQTGAAPESQWQGCSMITIEKATRNLQRKIR